MHIQLCLIEIESLFLCFNLAKKPDKKPPTKERSKVNASKPKSKPTEGPKKPPRAITKTPDVAKPPVMVEEATYAATGGYDDYSHLNVSAGQVPETEYDSIAYPGNWSAAKKANGKANVAEEDAYSTAAGEEDAYSTAAAVEDAYSTAADVREDTYATASNVTGG